MKISLCIESIMDLIESSGNKLEVKPKDRFEMLRGTRVPEYTKAEGRELHELVLNGTFEIMICPVEETYSLQMGL